MVEVVEVEVCCGCSSELAQVDIGGSDVDGAGCQETSVGGRGVVTPYDAPQ